MATICNHHVVASLEAIQRRGQSVQPLLIRAGINPQMAEEPGSRIHTEQVARLFKIVQLELGDEFMGFSANGCKIGAFRIMCDLVQYAQTLEELFAKALDFYRLLSDDVVLDLQVHKGNAVFTVAHHQASLDPRHFLREFLLVIWHRFPSWYIGEAIRLRETRFNFAKPEHHDELAVMFPGRLTYGFSENQLIFDASYLDKPLVRSRQELDYFVRNAPADVMTIPGVDNSLERQIERVIESQSGAGLTFPHFEFVAKRLGFSPQTLYRQLKASGTSYQKIKDDIRREMAIQKLMDEQLPVEQVSTLVGFAEARSFSRAFKQWTGMTPQRYRKHFGQVSDGRC